MALHLALTETERQHRRPLQKQRRDEAGYVNVVLLLDAGWAAGQVGQALGVDEATVYRYAQAWQQLGLAQ